MGKKGCYLEKKKKKAIFAPLKICLSFLIIDNIKQSLLTVIITIMSVVIQGISSSLFATCQNKDLGLILGNQL